MGIKKKIVKLFFCQVILGIFVSALVVTLLSGMPFGRAESFDGITVNISGAGYNSSERSLSWNASLVAPETSFSKVVLVSEPDGNNRFLNPLAMDKTASENAVKEAVLASGIPAGSDVVVSITDNHSGSSNDLMTITITPPADSLITGTLNFSFKTYSSNHLHYGSNGNSNVSNKLTLAAGTQKIVEETPTDITNTVSATARNTVVGGIITHSIVGYDPVENTITWEYDVNRSNTNLWKLHIESDIDSRIKYVMGSAKIKWDDDADFSPLADARGGGFGTGATQNEFHINWKDTMFFIVLVGKDGVGSFNSHCKVRYTTAIDTKNFLTNNTDKTYSFQSKGYTYLPSAYNNGGWSSGRQTASAGASFQVPNEILSKSISNEGEKATYTLFVNPTGSALSSSGSGQYQIKDTMDENLQIDLASVKVYVATRNYSLPSSGGVVIPEASKLLVKSGEPISCSASIDSDTNTLTIPVNDGVPYIITYEATAKANGTLNSRTYFSGTNYDSFNITGQKSLDFVIDSIVEKSEEESDEDTEKPDGGTETPGEDTEEPGGSTETPGEENEGGSDIGGEEGTETPGKDDGNESTEKDPEEEKPEAPAANGKVVIFKTDKDSNKTPLKGALIGLYSESTASTAPVATGTTGEDGTVTIEGLSVGIYYLKEITPPSGYKLNEGVFEVESKEEPTGRYIIMGEKNNTIPNLTPGETNNGTSGGYTGGATGGNSTPTNNTRPTINNTNASPNTNTTPVTNNAATNTKPTGTKPSNTVNTDKIPNSGNEASTNPGITVNTKPSVTEDTKPSVTEDTKTQTESADLTPSVTGQTINSGNTNPVADTIRPAQSDSQTRPYTPSVQRNELVASANNAEEKAGFDGNENVAANPNSIESTLETPVNTDVPVTEANSDTESDTNDTVISDSSDNAMDIAALMEAAEGVKFESAIDTDVHPLTLEHGTVVDGHRFDGWYLDPDYKIAYEIGTPLSDIEILYAKWTNLEVSTFKLVMILLVCIGLSFLFAGGSCGLLYLAYKNDDKDLDSKVA